MAFEKGHPKQGGRQAGTPNAKTEAWEQLGETILTAGADRFKKVLLAADDAEFAELYLKTLEFFKPKLSRISEAFSEKLARENWRRLISGPLSTEESERIAKVLHNDPDADPDLAEFNRLLDEEVL